MYRFNYVISKVLIILNLFSKDKRVYGKKGISAAVYSEGIL